MYKNLLLATDGSKLSGKAVTHAIGLAKAVVAKITAFYAAPDYPMPAYADGVVYEPVSRKEYAKLAAQDAVESSPLPGQGTEAAAHRDARRLGLDHGETSVTGLGRARRPSI